VSKQPNRLRAHLSSPGVPSLILPVVGLWLALAAALAAFTGRVVDWYLMTDELLYERLAISIAHSHLPLPRVHDTAIASLNQLYPLVIAPAFLHGSVPEALHDAHVLNAFVMASTTVPVFLLARRVTRSAWASCLVAVLSVCVPWIVYSSFLLTEVVAYPAFAWALLAVQSATAVPRLRNDLLALGAIGLAIFARTQFAVLLAVLPLAIVVHEIAFAAGGETLRDRLRLATRSVLGRHRLLVIVAVALAAAAAGLSAAGRLSDALGTYSVALEGDVLPSGIGRSFAEHAATLALGVGVLPFVLGVAWLLGGLVTTRAKERHAFTAVGTLAFLGVALEVTSYDLRFASGLVNDRYLFYLAPIVFVGFGAVLCDRAWPRWALLAPTAVMVVGFAVMPLRVFENLSLDTPVSALNDPLRTFAGSIGAARLLLAIGTVVAVALFLQAALLLRRSHVVATLVALALVAASAETGYTFWRLVKVQGASGRTLTLGQGFAFGWVDRTVGTDADVTMIPYPRIFHDYGVSLQYWWDVEFWNMSIAHSAVVDGVFSWTPSTFPTVTLRFDPRSGRANLSLGDYVASSERDARFRIAGRILRVRDSVLLIQTRRPWSAEWLALGLYDDGWSRPGRRAVIRVFSTTGQQGPVKRYVTIQLRAPQNVDRRPFRVVSNMSQWSGEASSAYTVRDQLPVCVPAGGFADVRISTREHSPGQGEPIPVRYWTPREVGVGITQVALADEVFPGCKRDDP